MNKLVRLGLSVNSKARLRACSAEMLKQPKKGKCNFRKVTFDDYRYIGEN